MEKFINEQHVNFEDALSERYLSYALSTIMSRSLPDVRDGLKPVHRRLLFAMLQLKLDPKTGHKKCARIVGDVIGKYHPHGEVAVYDALVRMAQSFASRYPLIDGQGNFGSIDGDNQAAMRYTEAKLTEYAMLLLKDIDEDTIDFKLTYDASHDEPMVLPATVPNLLANGTEGIAVGMATSIPPHNILELLDATVMLLEHPERTIKDLMKKVKGPDFPTGGILVESEASILKSYETGRGSFKLRAKWNVEELERGQYRIVITEIPYHVQKRTIIERLAALYQDKKIPFIDDFQDLSAEDIRIVLIPKSRNIEANVIMEHLFKQTDLEVKISLNMNALSHGTQPMVMSLKQILVEFIDHRNVVTVRRLKHRLGEVNHRLEILSGMLIAYLNLDEIIDIIRTQDEPKAVMIKKWQLSDVQAEAILNTRLRSLRKLEELQIKTEHDALSQEKTEIESILNSESLLKQKIIQDIKDTQKLLSKKFLYKRKTEIGNIEEILMPAIEEFIEKEPLVISYSELGWLKAFKGTRHDNIKFKEGDKERFLIDVCTTDKLLIFTDYGKFYTLPCDKISRGKGDGEPIRLTLNMEAEENVVEIFKYQSDQKFLLASRDGRGFIINSADVLAHTKGGKNILSTPSHNAAFCKVVTGNSILCIGENRKLLIIDIKEIPLMKKGRGVTLQKFKQGGLKDLIIFQNADELKKLIPSIEKNFDLWKAKRATAGRLIMGRIWLDRK